MVLAADPDTSRNAMVPRTMAARRRELGLSQVELAARLRVDHTTVSRWESGKRRPPHDLVGMIAAQLDVTSAHVAAWFRGVPRLTRDSVGRLPGLVHLFESAGLDIDTVADLAHLEAPEIRSWVQRRRSVPRAAAASLAAALGMSREEFIAQARRRPRSDAGSPLADVRRMRDLTQKQLSVAAGVSTAAISHWESGKTMPSAAHLYRLARALRVEPTSLGRAIGRDLEADNLLSVDSLPPNALLRELRLRQGLTAAELGRCVGVGGATVRRWERGLFQPRERVAQRLAQVLGVSPSALRHPDLRRR